MYGVMIYAFNMLLVQVFSFGMESTFFSKLRSWLNCKQHQHHFIMLKINWIVSNICFETFFKFVSTTTKIVSDQKFNYVKSTSYIINVITSCYFWILICLLYGKGSLLLYIILQLEINNLWRFASALVSFDCSFFGCCGASFVISLQKSFRSDATLLHLKSWLMRESEPEAIRLKKNNLWYDPSECSTWYVCQVKVDHLKSLTRWRWVHIN